MQSPQEKQRIEQLADFNSRFQEESVYPMLLWIGDKTEQRLTKSKTSFFNWGFDFTKGEAQFPTFFALKRKFWMKNNRQHQPNKRWSGISWFLVFEGNILDDVDHKYVLSLQKKDDGYILGYNQVGEKVYLIFSFPGFCQVNIEHESTLEKFALGTNDKLKAITQLIKPNMEPFGQFTHWQFRIKFDYVEQKIDYDFNKPSMLKTLYGDTLDQYQGDFKQQMMEQPLGMGLR